MIQTFSLYFPSARQFDDLHEGAITWASDQRRNVKNPGRTEAELHGFESLTSSAFEELRRLTKVNSWHANSGESAAMWKLYAPQGKGLVVQSTVSRLSVAFQDFRLKPEYGSETTWLGRVRYLDYISESMVDNSMLGIFFHKRKFYEHENEVRAIVSLRLAEEFGASVPEDGILVGVDLHGLLESVHLGPTSVVDSRRYVERLLNNQGISCPVMYSDMDAEPRY